MDLIAQNPYRVLGMFANDSLKVMTANIARIRAFSKVGKEINFVCDNVEIFGPVNRSNESIQKAISRLSDSISAKTWQLFWIHSTGDTKNCIDTESITTAAYINHAVLALNDKYFRGREAAIFYSKVFEKNINETNLFDANVFWSGEEEKSTVAKYFLNILVPEAKDDPWLFLHEGQKGWFWWFRPNLYTKNCLREALNIKYKGFAFEELNKITQNNYLVHTFKEKYYRVLWHARPYLDILETFSSYIDSEKKYPEDIQLIRDKFACYLINFCMLVYERNTYWDAIEIEDIINFMEDEIRELAYVSSTINLLENKIEELCKTIPFLAPKECKNQSDQIRELIRTFCEKKDEVKWSLSLVRQSVKPLLQIRDIVGVENSYYKHISTKIADNAIYSADVDLSTAVRMYSNPENDRYLAMSHLKTVLKQCKLLAANIGLFNLEEEFFSGKFHSFTQLIERTANKYGIPVGVVTPDISMSSDYDLFMACGDDYQKLKQFILSQSENQYLEQAIQKIWDIEDKAFPKEGDSNIEYRKALLAYKAKFPSSHNEEKLLNEILALLFGQEFCSIFEYRQFIRLWPDHPKKQVALDRIDKLTFLSCSTKEDFKQYLNDYPQGKYLFQAGAKIIEFQKIEIKKIFDRCETIDDYNQFISKYPTSNLLGAARAKIEDIVYANAQLTNNYAIYLMQYPNGRHSVEAKAKIAKIQQEEKAKRENEDHQYWATSKQHKSYDAYLTKFPNGLHAKEAEHLLRQWNFDTETVKDVTAIIIIVASLITFCYLIF